MLLDNFTEIKKVSLFGGIVEDWNSLTKYKSMHNAPDI